jgi:hypothetical protein
MTMTLTIKISETRFQSNILAIFSYNLATSKRQKCVLFIAELESWSNSNLFRPKLDQNWSTNG